MPEVRLRPKGQITIPATILERAQLKEDAVLDVDMIGGVITLTPRASPADRDDLLGYAGVFRGAWGPTHAEADRAITEMRDEWER